MKLSAVLLLAIGISLDGLVAGIAYGFRRVGVPLASVGIASLISGAAVLLAMQAGALIGRYIDTGFVPRLGALILVGLGLWSVIQARRQADADIAEHALESAGEDMILNVRLQPFGLVIQVWKEPLKADLDYSGAISGWEAVLLGVALALDAVGIGLAAALAGFPLLTTCVSVIVVSFLALSGGLFVGSHWAKQAKVSRAMFSHLPGGVLMAIGFWWLLTAGG
ncbi:MAG: sporulation membrane protein YtaF [Firmicutes bacterium]|nr:sporulation membrane protein YtaF [Bacillota bacterium]